MSHDGHTRWLDGWRIARRADSWSATLSAGTSSADFETEANVFAAYLLMPDGIFERDAERSGGGDLCDTQWLEKLARKYRVPVGAVAYRLLLSKG